MRKFSLIIWPTVSKKNFYRWTVCATSLFHCPDFPLHCPDFPSSKNSLNDPLNDGERRAFGCPTMAPMSSCSLLSHFSSKMEVTIKYSFGVVCSIEPRVLSNFTSIVWGRLCRSGEVLLIGKISDNNNLVRRRWRAVAICRITGSIIVRLGIMVLVSGWGEFVSQKM